MNKTDKWMNLSFLAVLAALLCFQAGCVGYTLGTTLPHDLRTLHVPTFRNQTGEPMIENTLTDHTIAQFQFDGSLRIAEQATADAILEVTLLSYTLEPVVYERERQTAAREYRVRVIASAVMIRQATDEVIVDQPRIEAEATFQVAGDMSSSKNRALPELGRDLARRIVDAVTQTW